MSQTGAMADLAELARTTLSRNRFMVLGTVDPSGRPRVSPVWFSLVDHRVAYWLSSPDARHSRNIEQRPEVSMVVFDSSADPHTGQAVYLDATAGRVPDDELGDACAEAFRDVDDELSYTSETLRDEPFVLYRARVTARARTSGCRSSSEWAETGVLPLDLQHRGRVLRFTGHCGGGQAQVR
jgi:nitroimidazol reductase NimA-like FMN-containing flavoprotein (pyridoxamine 5'-phosphate oxidase superfamily)